MEPKEGHFGERLIERRRAAGLTQRELARSSGVSNRMIAYYESRSALPPGHVLTALAEALGASVDEIVGKATEAPSARPRLSRTLLEKLTLLERLPLKDKRELFAIMDTYLAKNQLVPRQRRAREAQRST